MAAKVLAGKSALITGASRICRLKVGAAVLRRQFNQIISWVHPPVAGSVSPQGLGYGILRALAAAGANVGMHGIGTSDELQHAAQTISDEFGVKVSCSACGPLLLRRVSQSMS